ncbi:MAG: hypothetical protein WCO52_03135 [bacterium]
MHIVATYGDLRAGKDYIAEELSRRLPEFISYPTSLPIRRLLDALHTYEIDSSDEDRKDAVRRPITQVSKAGHDAFGPDIWLDLSLRDARSQGVEGVALTGLRLADNLKAIHRHGGLNIWVEASRETIVQRYAAKGLVLTEELYNNQWDNQVRPYKADRALMDLVVRNDGNAEETEADLRQALDKIKAHFSILG